MHYSRIFGVLLAALMLTSSGPAHAVEFEDFWGRDYSPGQPSTTKRVTVYAVGVLALAGIGVAIGSQVDAHHWAKQAEDVKAAHPANQICAYPYEPTCMQLADLKHKQGVDVSYTIVAGSSAAVLLLGDILLARLWPNHQESARSLRLVPSLGGASLQGSF